MFFLRTVIWPFDQLYPNLMNGNSVTVLSPNCYSVVQTKTQKEPDVFRKHLKGMKASKSPVLRETGVVFKRGSPRIITREQVSNDDVKSTMI